MFSPRILDLGKLKLLINLLKYTNNKTTTKKGKYEHSR